MQWQWDKHQSRDKNSQRIFMLPRPLSETILCEVNHGWYFDTLKLFAIQAVQFATEIHYSDSSLFGSVSFAFGHKQMFCLTPDTSASGDHLEQLWDPGGLASYICSTCALTSLMHYLFEVWLAYATPICIQLRMEKPMASGELNQWMTIHFLYGTWELDYRLDKFIELRGFLLPLYCQSCKSTRSGKICVWGTPHGLGCFTVVQEGYGTSASNQGTLQGGRGFITGAVVVVVQGSIDHKYYLNFDQDYVGNDHFRGASWDGVTIGHGYHNFVVQVNPDFDYHQDFKLVKKRRMQWDPGGSRWCRLGVKPHFKEGGMLGALLPSRVCAGPLGQLRGPGPFRNHQGDKSLGGGDVETIQWITDEPAAAPFSYLLLSPRCKLPLFFSSIV